MLGTAQAGSGKPRTDLKAFGRRQRQHRLGEHRVELVEHRFAPASREIPADTADHTADRILGLQNFTHQRFHPRRRRFVRAARQVSINLIAVHTVNVHIDGLFGTNGANPGDDLHAPLFSQNLFRDRPGCHPTDRLTGAGPTTAAAGADTVLGLVGEVGMRWPRHQVHFAVIARTLVLVVHQQANWRAQGQTIFNSGQDCHLVSFFTRRGEVALARTSPV